MKVSYSAISTFLECGEKYWLKYGAGLRVIRPLPVFEVGSIVHEALAVLLRAHARGEPLPAIESAVRDGCVAMRERKTMTDMCEENAQIAVNALEYHVPRMQLDRWETVMIDGEPAVELELEVPFAGARLCAHVDWVARSKESGKVYIIDHKTTKHRLPEQPYVYHDLQLALYKHAFYTQHGIQTDGSMLHQMSTYPPSPPKRLARPSQGRKFSTAKSTRSNRETFCAGLHEAGESVTPYLEFLNTLDASEAKRPFRRWTPDRTSPEGHAAMIDKAALAVREMMDIRERRREPIANRVNEWTCGRCEYRSLCDAKMLGYDPRSLIHSVYSPDDDSVYADDYDTDDDRAYKLHLARLSHTGVFNVHGWSPHT